MHDLTQISRRGKYCITLSVLYPLPQSEKLCPNPPCCRDKAGQGGVAWWERFFPRHTVQLSVFQHLRCDGHWSCPHARLLWLLASPRSCRQGGIGFHNPSFQAPTRLLEGEECARENIPTAVKRHSFLCPFLGQPFLHHSRGLAGSTRCNQPRVTLGCLCPPSLPLLQIIAIMISRLL